ncbi:Spy0128 family protein [uncultured Bifidobacterium sp.]|uniref:Spy0128 family protein n=1 Tax=uncultured Bifidobacterium sp. TaxID=165187 RepID=UPI00258C6C75|nr:LPXTG cell wall anchor domain-containing protein [uncultured Bifidobacterium sp.]
MRGLGRGLRRALGACLAVAALIAATAGGAYADDPPATGDAGTTAGAARKDVDGDTKDTYTGDNGSGVLGDKTSTRYSGRVWTDKTVTTEGQTFTNPNDHSQTITVPNNSDFLVTYSALATSTETIRQRPTDTVFVLDFSMTMGQRMDGSEIKADPNQVDQTRMYVMLNALEDAMQDLAKANTSNRIGIVVFVGHLNDNSQSQRVLLPLTPVTEFTTPTPSGDSVYTTPDKFFTITDMKMNVQYTQMGVRCNLQPCNTLWTGNWTPTQAGLYDAMQMLLKAEVTPGQERQPNVVLMSDGATNQINVNKDDLAVWYEDVDTGDKGMKIQDTSAGANSSPFAAFATVLMGSYLDERVGQRYGTDNTVYTIGVTGNSSNDQIRFALDPEPYLTEAVTPTTDPNRVVEKSREAISKYLAGGTDPVTVQGVNGTNAQFAIVKDDEERVVPQDFDYVDTYYEAHKADDLENAFADIAGNITAHARYPIDTTGGLDTATGDGYITYEDPIGDYMQVKDVTTLIYMGEQVLDPTSSTQYTNGIKVTTYTFNHEFHSPVDGQTYDTSQIIIQRVETPDHRQTLKVMIPYKAIPMRVNRLTLNSDGTVSKNIVDGNLPLRLCYTVGLRDDVNRYSLAGVDPTYVNANKTDDGTVLFYSNAFTKDNEGRIRAGATVTFTPAKDNPFYFIQEDTPLYTDEECGTPATTITEKDDYYFRITYYQGTEKETAVVKRAGSLMSGYVKEKNGAMYLQKGAPRLGYLQDLTVLKDDNLTGTASTYREPTFEGDPETGKFVVYLGNNGRLGIKAATPGIVTATVRKTLTGRDWMDDEKFRFSIVPTNGGPLPTGDDVTDNQDGTVTLAIGKPDDGATNTASASLTFTFPAETDFNGQGQVVYTYKVTEIRGDQPSIDWDGHTATITITVRPDGDDADLALDVDPPVYDNALNSEDGNDSINAAVFTNTFKPVSSLPLTGDGTTARNLLAVGGVALMLAGAAWLLARRRRV